MFLSKLCGNLVSKFVPLISTNVVQPMAIHTSSALAGEVARYRSGKEMRKSVGQKTDGITSADAVDIDVTKLVPFIYQTVNFLFVHSFIILLRSFFFAVNVSSDFQTAIYRIKYSTILHSKTCQLLISKWPKIILSLIVVIVKEKSWFTAHAVWMVSKIAEKERMLLDKQQQLL